MIVLSGTLDTDLCTAPVVNRIRRENMEFLARDQVLGKAVPTRFTDRIKFEIPHVFRKRGRKYEARKQRQFGHTTPNVRTGRLKKEMPATAKVVAQSTRGRVILRFYWAGKAKAKSGGGFAKQGATVQQRAEFETLSQRETDRMANAASRRFTQQISLPENKRRRRVRASAAAA